MWWCAQCCYSVSTCISGLSTARLIFPPALWLLSTKCILTIHSYNSTYCTLPPPSQCVCVWCTGCGCRKPREGGDGSSTGANCGPDTHTAVHIYIWVSVCVCVCGGAEQQLNISLRTLLSDCCREGGNGRVKEVVCLYLTSVSAPRVELLA